MHISLMGDPSIILSRGPDLRCSMYTGARLVQIARGECLKLYGIDSVALHWIGLGTVDLVRWIGSRR